VDECNSDIIVGREAYREGMSGHYMFFNFVATLKKYSRKEFETGISSLV